MPKVFDILDELNNTASRNAKLEILNRNKDDTVLQTVVKLALDPLTQFYIKKIPQYDDHAPYMNLPMALANLSMLSSRTYTGNKAISFLRDMLKGLEKPDADVLARVVAKDLRCGVNIGTVSKIWPGLVFEYPVLLCEPFDQKLIDKLSWPAYVQLKEDGMRFNAIVTNNDVEFRSRNGKVIDLTALKHDFTVLAKIFGEDVVFDGELLVRDAYGNALDRKTGNGILNKAVKGTISSIEDNLVCATLWDVIPYEHFKQGRSPIPYWQRYESLIDAEYTKKLSLVPTSLVESFEHSMMMYDAYIADGKEGAIIKDRNHHWEDKRSKGCIKLKSELECDLEIVGYNKGTGKNVDILGALVMKTKDRKLTTAVGTGFSDEQRKTLTPENTIGKIGTVKYNAKIQNKQGGWSLFLPRWVELREDKDTADTFEQVK